VFMSFLFVACNASFFSFCKSRFGVFLCNSSSFLLWFFLFQFSSLFFCLFCIFMFFLLFTCFVLLFLMVVLIQCFILLFVFLCKFCNNCFGVL
jgi:hypothetical protein